MSKMSQTVQKQERFERPPRSGLRKIYEIFL